MTDISNFKVNQKKCSTCPFRPEKDPEVRDEVKKRVLSHSQICHHTNTTLCRGARDYQIVVFHGCGIIESASEEAWANARDKYGC